MLSEIKYRLSTHDKLTKSIGNLFDKRLKKCYESMNNEKQESLMV